MNRSVKLVLTAIVGVCGIVLYREHLPLRFWLGMAALAGMIALITVGAGKLYLILAAKRPPQRRPNPGILVIWTCAISLSPYWLNLLNLPHRLSLILSSLLGLAMFSFIGVGFARMMHWQRVAKHTEPATK